MDRVVVSWSRGDRPRREGVIEDAKAVERFLTFLREHNDGWRKPWGTFPTPQYDIYIKRDNELLLVVWIGANWLGGREGSGSAPDNRLRSLSDGERAEMFDLLGLPKD